MSGIRYNIIDRLRAMGSRRGRPHVRLVVGLGNPGLRYADTRHNVGFWCVEHLAEVNSVAISQRRRHVEIGEGVIAGQPVVLAKPRTFMNESGRAVQSLLARYRSSPDDLLTIYDDMDLPVGKLRLRPHGSAGGHNGMRSVVDAIGSSDFPQAEDRHRPSPVVGRRGRICPRTDVSRGPRERGCGGTPGFGSGGVLVRRGHRRGYGPVQSLGYGR